MNAAKTLMTLAIASLASTAGAAEIWDHSPPPVPGKLIWNGFSDGSTRVNVAKSVTDSPAVSYVGSGGQFSGSFYTDGTANADEFFRFFCIDLFQYANTGPNSYTESLLPNNALARLYDIAFPNESAEDFYNGGQTNFGTFGSNVLSSAFQLSVWEIIYETGGTYGLGGSGTFWSNMAANDSGTDAQKSVYQANAWLTQLNSGAGSASGWTLYKFASDARQDYVSATYRAGGGTPTGSVPEPGSLSLLGLGLGAFAFTRRKRAATPEPALRAKPKSGSHRLPGMATMHMMRPVIFLALSCVLNSTHAALIDEVEPNDILASAQDLSGHFSTDFVAEIFDSTTHPHVSMRGRTASANDVDIYRLFVPTAGVTGFFDIDGACSSLSLDEETCGEGTDTILTLFDAGQRVLADSDDAGRTTDPGSATIFDAFLGTYRFNAAGWYFIAVSNYMNFTDFDLAGQAFPMVRPDDDYGGIYYEGSGATFTWDQDGLYAGGNYTLHVSLSQVPEPATLALFGLGLAGIGYQRRRAASF